MFKRFVTAVVLLAPGAAAAGDFQPSAYPQPPFNWSGAYLGAEVGGGWFGDEPQSDPAYVGVDTSGFLGGIYGGYNWQVPGNNIVLGVDTDFTFSGVGGDGHNSGGYAASTDWKWMGSVRGRVGYAFDRFLPYIAGGLAYGRFSTSYAFPSGEEVDGEKTVTGWTVGGGLDYAVTEHLTARFEYRYSDFGSNKVMMNYQGQPYGDFDIKSNIHDVRLGLSYKF